MAVLDFESCEGERELIDYPPQDSWLINPDTDKFETPIDERGFVDVPKLVEAVKGTIDPEYGWPDRINLHHIFWKAEWYHSRFIGANALRFRELPVHKILVPVEFHNWLHRVTIPPDVPDPELIRNRNESWTVAHALFRTSRSIIQLERQARRRAELIGRRPDILPARYEGVDIIGQEYVEEMSAKYFTGIEMDFERLNEIPEEHRFIELGASPYQIASTLGRVIVPGALKLTTAVAA